MRRLRYHHLRSQPPHRRSKLSTLSILSRTKSSGERRARLPLSRPSSSGSTPSMLHARSAALSRRHSLVRETLARYSVDALVVTSRSNIFYLTNFTGSSAIAVVTRDRLHFVTDFRYVTAVESLQQSAEACPGLQLTVVEGTYDGTLVRLLASLGVQRVGFEAAHLTVSR